MFYIKFIIAILLSLNISLFAQKKYPPTVSLEAILHYEIYGNGLMNFKLTDIAFGPQQPVDAKVYIGTQEGKGLAGFAFRNMYTNVNGVFSRLIPNGYAGYTFKPGKYALVYEIAGQYVTRFPFSVVEHSKSDDPFNPSTKLKFVGPWQQWVF